MIMRIICNKAADAAEELINSGEYRLYSTDNPEEDYLMLFAEEDANPDEYILAIKFDYGMSVYHNATAHTFGTYPRTSGPDP